jgi:hypothetical protein
MRSTSTDTMEPPESPIPGVAVKMAWPYPSLRPSSLSLSASLFSSSLSKILLPAAACLLPHLCILRVLGLAYKPSTAPLSGATLTAFCPLGVFRYYDPVHVARKETDNRSRVHRPLDLCDWSAVDFFFSELNVKLPGVHL